MKYLLMILTLLLLLGCTLNKPIKEGLFSKTIETRATVKEALIVGVSDYSGTESDLIGVEKDVIKMKNLFSEWGFHVTVLTNKESLKLEEHLEDYVGLKANDKFIFYYSGHGYHTKDENGDEEDGEDEALVLSDGVNNELFLDDSLFGYLNSIKAKKMVMFDSCHSGTAFRGFTLSKNKPKVKSLKKDLKHLLKIIETKIFPSEENNINSGEYVIFSASQDNEQSLDTKEGGMFTKAFYTEIKKNNGKYENMMNLKIAMTNNIGEWCKDTDSTAYHPNLSTSSANLKSISISEFLGL